MDYRVLSLLCRVVPGAVLAAAFAGCVSEPSAVTGERKSFAYSWEQEVQLGEQSDQQITQQMGLLEDPALQQYVKDVGQRVLTHSDFREADTPELYENTAFTFRVLDSPVVNAFALPGGYVYVTRGLLTHAQNEAQLAVVLGHEIGHVAARHASQQALRAQLSQLGLFAGAILGQEVLGEQMGNIGQMILEQGGAALQLLMFRYSREAEHESDELGVRYASAAGYSTIEGADFFRTLERMSEREGKALPSWSSTHPDPGERAQRVRELSGQTTTIGAGASVAQRIVNQDEYLQRLEGMVMGDNPREGFQQNDAFVHPELAFRFPVPEGWRLQNERSMVVMGDPQGRAIVGFEIVPGNTPREAAAQLAQQEGIEVVSAQDVRINGLPATLVAARANTQQGPLGILSTFIQYNNRIYSFLGYTSASLFSQYQPLFEQVAGGFMPVTDPAILEIQPARVKLVRAERDAPFREFVPRVLPLNLTAEGLAILNQVELDERIVAGTVLKLPSLTPGAAPPPSARPIGEPVGNEPVIGEPVIGQPR